MRSTLALTALLLLPSAVTAEVFSGDVIAVRYPTATDDGLLVVKKDIVAKGAKGVEVRIVRERSFVFARHLADGRYLPQHDKSFRQSFPTMPRDLVKGDHVGLDFKVDSQGRSVIQGIKCRKLPKQGAEKGRK